MESFFTRLIKPRMLLSSSPIKETSSTNIKIIGQNQITEIPILILILRIQPCIITHIYIETERERGRELPLDRYYMPNTLNLVCIYIFGYDLICLEGEVGYCLQFTMKLDVGKNVRERVRETRKAKIGEKKFCY